MGGYAVVLVWGVVVFTVYRFCNTDNALFAGSPFKVLLAALDGAAPGLLVGLGFLVLRPLVTAYVDGRAELGVQQSVARFAVLLLPAYYLTILVVWFPRQHRLPGDWADLAEHLTFTQVFDSRRIYYTVGPAWAISIAVLSSILLAGLLSWGAVLGRRCAWSRTVRVTSLAVLVAALFVTSVVWDAWSYAVRDLPLDGAFSTWYGLVGNLDLFGTGLGLALFAAVVGDHPPLSGPLRGGLRLLGVLVLVGATLSREHHAWVTLYFASASAVGFGLLFAAEVVRPRSDDLWTRALGGWVARRLAPLSLGVYLWHEPVMLALRHVGLVRQDPDAFVRDLVVVALASVATSWATYVAIQVPALQLYALARRGRSSTGLRPVDTRAVNARGFHPR